jgi:hypothetical protein
MRGTGTRATIGTGTPAIRSGTVVSAAAIGMTSTLTR